MPPRFYVPEARADDSTIDLPRDEAAHLTRVLRLTTGAHIRVFNGDGDEWDARVHEAGKHRVTAQLEHRVSSAPEARVPITLAVSVLKGDKMDDIVRDAVMLGVAAIQPVVSARTEIAVGTIENSGRLGRWQRIAVASAKQCGRAVVPKLLPPRPFDEAMRVSSHAIMLIEPSAARAAVTLNRIDRNRELHPLTLFIGPEGGWTEQEIQRAHDGGAMLLTLGAQTLRADAVPIVALTALRVQLEDF